MKIKRKKSISNFVAIAIAVLFGISMIVVGGIKPVFAAQPEAKLSLNSRNDSENIPFVASNMFPGDMETGIYCVKVVYEDTVTVLFRVDIGENYEKLAEVLKCKIVLKNTGETLYDGLMKDTIKAIDYTLAKAESGEAELTYEISVYLNTGVGNEYQNKALKADFVWWIEETEDVAGTGESLQQDSDMGTEGQGSPLMGDKARLSLWGALALCLAACIGTFIFRERRTVQNGKNGPKVRRKILMSVVAIILLTAGLAVTTYAFLYQALAVEANVFQTGTVDINFNDNEPVIKPYEFLFEPGMLVEKDFFVENKGTVEVYYRIYFANVEGRMANALEITIKEADEVLYTGKASDLTRENACMSESALGVGEKVWLTATFYYPENEGNETQLQDMSFDIIADAVQTKNNQNRLFE